jgi:predicted ATPase/class 3 adenylate cyclase
MVVQTVSARRRLGMPCAWTSQAVRKLRGGETLFRPARRPAQRGGARVAELPTGTVTLLFTDIEGSTRLLRSLKGEYGRVLSAHRAVMRQAFSCHGGHEFGTEGDASFVAFGSPQSALLAAAAAQTGLAGYAWPNNADVRVRMGVHTGTPTVVDGDYVGLDVHRVARICSAGHGGQVLVSDATRSLVGEGDTAELGFRDLGYHRLKDLDRPERLHQLVARGLRKAFPPVRSLPPASNLPSIPTSFVGRGRELADVHAMLEDPAVRLLTLTGPGGTGKTRLALEAAGSLVERFPDGVWFVPLAAIEDSRHVGLAVVEALGLSNAQGRPTGELVAEHLGDRSVLLILDNFERVAAAAGWVHDLLSRAPQAKALVTSRAVLNLSEEHEYRVPPLPLPPRAAGDPRALLESEAVALFVQRARAVSPHFGLKESTAPAVAEVCARLDGLPLAIELAAGHLRLLSLEDLRRRLQARLPLLESRARDLPDRQRTLRNTIDWSYRLLAPDDQALFRRLAVFVGGWTLESAEAVVGTVDGAQGDLLSGLATLVEHSMVWRDEAAGTTRYRMLSTIREYAIGELERSGELAALRRRHAEHLIAVSETANLHLEQPDQMAWLAWFDAEMDNLRAALTWALERSSTDEDRQATALRFARSLGWLWYTRGDTREALSWLERVLEAGTEGPRSLRAPVLYLYAAFADRQGQAERAIESLQESVALFRAEDDGSRVAKALNALGDVTFRHGGHTEARRLWDDALTLVHDSSNPTDEHTVGLLTANLGILALEEGRLEEARALLERGLAVVHGHGDHRAVAQCQPYLAKAAAAEGDLPRAFALLSEALKFFDQWNDRPGLASCLEALAAMAAREREAVRAARLVGAAATVREAAGAPLLLAERNKLEQYIAPASAALGEEGLATATAEGQAMTLEQTVNYALTWAQGRSGATPA